MSPPPVRASLDMPPAIRSATGCSSSKSSARRHIAVDSPPGITRPSTPARCSGSRTRAVRAPQARSSLDALADHYAVFEPDQLLTHGQLNSVADFLDDQQRLSRVALAGVGVIAGLHVALGDGAVRISRGPTTAE